MSSLDEYCWMTEQGEDLEDPTSESNNEDSKHAEMMENGMNDNTRNAHDHYPPPQAGLSFIPEGKRMDLDHHTSIANKDTSAALGDLTHSTRTEATTTVPTDPQRSDYSKFEHCAGQEEGIMTSTGTTTATPGTIITSSDDDDNDDDDYCSSQLVVVQQEVEEQPAATIDDKRQNTSSTTPILVRADSKRLAINNAGQVLQVFPQDNKQSQQQKQRSPGR